MPDGLRHIPRGVVRFAHTLQVLASEDAEMVVIDAGDEYAVQMGHLGSGNGRFKEQRHIEALQHRVDHQDCAPAVEHDSATAQPAQFCVGGWIKSLLHNGLC